MTVDIERRILQLILILVVLVPLVVSIPGIFRGPEALNSTTTPIDFDNHFRGLSGILLAVAIGLGSCVPHIEWCSGRFRMVGGIIFLGGFGQLVSYWTVGGPSQNYVFAMLAALILMPLLMIWQTSLASRWRRLRMPMI